MRTDALKQAGYEKSFTDLASGAKADRPGLNEALEYLREGDTLVVWKLDRMGRSLNHLIQTVTQLDKQKIGFKSIQESLDTTTSGGKLIFHIFGAIAEFEREIIQERTQAGLSAARARGKKGERRTVVMPQKIAMAKALAADPERASAEICEVLKMSPATYYRRINS